MRFRGKHKTGGTTGDSGHSPAPTLGFYISLRTTFPGIGERFWSIKGLGMGGLPQSCRSVVKPCQRGVKRGETAIFSHWLSASCLNRGRQSRRYDAEWRQGA
ncbi:hypothetical protein Ga0080574_TMP4114 [Salipiger abyssi]|uniref:Uncharacterized protein n=1 Tax=Salipiger abyssi TaxID=1250539 RepID=A0A1P8UYH9_9RHOB|nr:hypothetical protein Ga0080574_TMP4114 [Salipiger abyssi]